MRIEINTSMVSCLIKNLIGATFLATAVGCVHNKPRPTEQTLLPQPVTRPVSIADATPKPKEQPKPSVAVLASIEKSGCYGTCPVFEATILADGTAHWVGLKNTLMLGTYTAVVPQIWLEELLEKAESVGYFTLSNQYPINGKRVIDFPTTSTYIFSGQKKWSIEDNFDAPLILQDFEKFFLRKLETLDWKPVK